MVSQKTLKHLLKATAGIFVLCVVVLIVSNSLLRHVSNNVQHVQTDRKNSTEIPLEGYKRRSKTTLLKEHCRKIPEANETPLSQVLRDIVVIDRYKVLYCRAGKTGSWTTLQLLYNLELNTNMTRQEVRKLAVKKPLPVLADFSEKDIHLRLATYKKFLVARNPLERVASVWSGFFAKYPVYGWNERYRSMMETVCPEMTTRNVRLSQNITTELMVCNESTEIKGIGNQTHQLIPFRAFVKAVAASGNRTEFSNVHWKPIHSICTPCQLNYDFVAHTDNLAEDLHTFFRKVGVVGRDNIFPKKHPRTGDTMLWEVFKKVSLEDIYQIGERFKNEYAFFGYSLEDDLQKLIKLGISKNVP